MTRRNELGIDNKLLQEFRLEELDEYQMFSRKFCENIDELLQLVDFDIKKINTRLREAKPAKIKLSARLVDFDIRTINTRLREAIPEKIKLRAAKIIRKHFSSCMCVFNCGL